MAKVLTTDQIVAMVKRRGAVPIHQKTFKDSDIIDILNEEMSIHILPMVMKAHEEYYVYSEDVSLVVDQQKYEIPYRAIGNKLRDVFRKDISNNLFEMSRISPDQKGDTYQFETGIYGQFYVENNSVVLMSRVTNSTESLQMSYYLRPNELVADKRGGVITAIDTVLGIVTVATFPSHFSSAEKFDFIAAKSPNKILSFDITPVSTSSAAKTVTFDANDLPSTLAVGDYVMKAEETIVAQLPTELIAVLAQRAIVKILESQGDQEGLAAAKADLATMESNSLQLIDDRIEGAPMKVVNRSGHLRSNDNLIRRRW